MSGILVTDIQVGTLLIPEGGPDSSAIEVLKIEDNGVTFKRLHPHWNGEEFMLRWDQLLKAHWIVKPAGVTGHF